MTPFEKCPVCSGDIIEKEVEKVLRVGNHTEIVKVQAAVCFRCGERLYTPEVVKLFEEIRSKLEDKELATVHNTALRTKLDYEIWFLSFLEKNYDRVQGKDDPPVIELTSGDEFCNVEMVSEDYLSSLYNATIINTMMPFTFMASFKTLDVIFEWIIEENFTTVPRPFKKKVELLKKESNLQLPTLFDSQPYLYTYAKALFCQLLPYRHEIVHKNSFSVSEDTLTLSSSEQGTSLILSSKQIDYLVRFVRALVRALVGDITIDRNKDLLLRYYLDVLGSVHGLDTFNQQVPLFVHVKLTAPKQGAAFPVDLKQVRDKLELTYPTQKVVFDLKVQAVDGEKLIAKWYFAPEEVPDLDVMTLYEESHKTHREALVK
ncbi:MAG: YgiT-type zinc finger protein [Gemmatimonadetes bacterium]|nr:YgiT-type zinc finger protein [Gemmatimonadota bacterium]